MRSMMGTIPERRYSDVDRCGEDQWEFTTLTVDLAGRVVMKSITWASEHGCNIGIFSELRVRIGPM